MAYTYDLSTTVGKVRRTVPDKVVDNYIWTDEEIQSFLDDSGGNWRRASALILETMASDDLIVLKVVKIHNLETNTDRLMSAMLKRAASLRAEAATEEANSADSDFEVAEMITNDFQYYERLTGEFLRS